MRAPVGWLKNWSSRTAPESVGNNGQLETATGWEPSGASVRLHEKLVHSYDAAGNLVTRTRNTLNQVFTINDLNQPQTVTSSGTLTVAGAFSGNPASVMVQRNEDPPLEAVRYKDKTYAREGIALPTSETEHLTVVASTSAGAQSSATTPLEIAASVALVYDSNGNLESDGRRTFKYDDENRLVAVEVENDWRTEFVYDGLSRMRVRKEFHWQASPEPGDWSLASETRYIYDGMRVIQERDGNNQPLVTYTRGLDLSGTLEGAGGIGGLLARTDANGTAYYHCDGSGNVTALVKTLGSPGNEQQVVIARYLYDPFGNILGQWGPLADANVYRFSSKEYHANSGLYYYGFRFYDPNLQRWINRDPAGERWDLNLYRFARNNPITYVDAQGECPLIPLFLAGAVAGAILTPEIANAPGPNDPIYRNSLEDYIANALIGGFSNALIGGLGGGLSTQNAVPKMKLQNPNVLSGHGGLPVGNASPVMQVPRGTPITVWTKHNNTIGNALGNAIETGAPITPKQFPEIFGARSYLPGSYMPNYTLYPPGDLPLLGNPTTVTLPTSLSDLVRPGMGNVHWNACTSVTQP